MVKIIQLFLQCDQIFRALSLSMWAFPSLTASRNNLCPCGLFLHSLQAEIIYVSVRELSIVGVNLSEPPQWHECIACACMLACVLGLTTYLKFAFKHMKIFHVYYIAHHSDSIGMKNSHCEQRRLELIVFAAHLATFK